MDARAMDPHDWNECGTEIADLFQGDDAKATGIRGAWICDLDEDEQELVHAFVCENKRGPDGLEAVQRFENYAAKREKVARERLAKVKAQQEKSESLSRNEEYQRLRHLIAEHTARTENAW